MNDAKTMTVTGTLPVGIAYDGSPHRAYTLRPLSVRDTIAVGDMPRARANDFFFGVCLLARQIVALGTIPASAITPELLEKEMLDIDLKELNRAREELEQRLRSFHDEEPGAARAGAGAV